MAREGADGGHRIRRLRLESRPGAHEAGPGQGRNGVAGEAHVADQVLRPEGDAAPGPVGSGVPWGDGDLQYQLSVSGNTFEQTGGDAGAVTGAFFGQAHEAMGGVLERSDLSAAFGGTR